MNEGTLLFVNFAVYSWLLLVPIILAKAWELRKTLPVTTGRIAATASLATLASTLVTTIAVLAAGWLVGLDDFDARPHAGEGDLAVLIALVPCFFISVWVDTVAGSAVVPSVPRKEVRAAFFRANQLGYAMIAIVPIVRFAKSAIWNGRLIW